jgi:hypothetical protein
MLLFSKLGKKCAKRLFKHWNYDSCNKCLIVLLGISALCFIYALYTAFFVR